MPDSSVRSITIFLDLPGGSVLGLLETADAIHVTNKVKPVRAFVSEIAVSAAYWHDITGQLNHVDSQAVTLGRGCPGPDIWKALENAGVKITAVTAGEHNLERAPFTPLRGSAGGLRAPANSTFGNGRMLSEHEELSAFEEVDCHSLSDGLPRLSSLWIRALASN